jgi:hypothetical protein
MTLLVDYQRKELLVLKGDCFASTKVQILTPQEMQRKGLLRADREAKLVISFTCFTGTKVQILTQKAVLDAECLTTYADLC